MSGTLNYIDTLNIISDICGVPVGNVIHVLESHSVPNNPDSVIEFFTNPSSVAGSTTSRVVSNSGSTLMNTVSTTATITDGVNSNLPVKAEVRVPVTTSIDATTGKVVSKGGMVEAGNFVVKTVAPAIAAAGAGIWLGKAFDSTLYNLSPNFWDSHNMSSLDPSKWSSITSGDDSLGAGLFDLIFGLDGDTTQAYIDEDALAYLSLWLARNGVVASGMTPSSITLGEQPTQFITGKLGALAEPICGKPLYQSYQRYANYDAIVCLYNNQAAPLRLAINQNSPTLNIPSRTTITKSGNNYKATGMPWVTTIFSTSSGFDGIIPTATISQTLTDIGNENYIYDAIRAYWGSNISPAPGFSNQDGATLPNTSGWNDVDSTKQSLQNQYPDAWNNAKHYTQVNPDGTTTGRTFIPIPIPNANNFNDPQPTISSSNQSKPEVNPSTDTETLTDLITKIITDILTPTDEPPTGEGDSPVTPVPTGSASNLWRIYNPTQAQVDAFGGWLWSSSFVEQLKKLFNDPMQAIIGIHKVFVNPSIGGQTTIQCGYLDSEIPSAWVNKQYVTVDCGTISLNEKYLGVFDYSPYTEINMFLPFIGIVPLDVGDCMRGQINVKYHVDVLTGACLAEIRIKRDGFNVCMYTYSGSAIVSYPLSSGSYMGIVGGTLAIAGGIAGTIASGGALLPAALGAGAAASHLHTNVKRSGDFSGCAGAMGIKKPYLIISRPQLALASNYEHYTGIPANSKHRLGDCSGYVRVKQAYPNTIHYATEEEKDMIYSELRAGVLI